MRQEKYSEAIGPVERLLSSLTFFFPFGPVSLPFSSEAAGNVKVFYLGCLFNLFSKYS